MAVGAKRLCAAGVCYPPFNESLPAAKARAEKRQHDTWQARLEKYLA